MILLYESDFVQKPCEAKGLEQVHFSPPSMLSLSHWGLGLNVQGILSQSTQRKDRNLEKKRG